MEGLDPFSLSNPTKVQRILTEAGFPQQSCIDVREPLYYGENIDVSVRAALLDAHVVRRLRFGELAGAPDHRRRRVASQHAPHRRASRRFARRQSGPASDVEDVLIATDIARSAQYLVV